MADETAKLHAHIRQTILDHVSESDERRAEAIREFFSVTMPGMDVKAAGLIAQNAPPLLPVLYEKWIFMFAKRLFETAPLEQIQTLCDGSEDNNAAIALSYIMFLESERMEKQIEQDLAATDLGGGVDEEGAAAMAEYIRSRMARIGEEEQKAREKRAAAYKASRSPVN